MGGGENMKDLFSRLGDLEFLTELFGATEKRIKHHADWASTHDKEGRPDGTSREYHKARKFMDLKRAILPLLK